MNNKGLTRQQYESWKQVKCKEEAFYWHKQFTPWLSDKELQMVFENYEEQFREMHENEKKKKQRKQDTGEQELMKQELECYCQIEEGKIENRGQEEENQIEEFKE